MTDEISIGTRLWRFDENRRIYQDRASGPTYEGHFEPFVVVGETKGTWKCARNEQAHPRSWSSVNKKTLREPATYGWRGRQWFTDAGRDAAIWANGRRHEIVSLVQACDVATLKKIAAVLEENTP